MSLAARILIPLGLIGAVILAFVHMNTRLDAERSRAELAVSQRQQAEQLVAEKGQTIDVLATKLLADQAATRRQAETTNNLAAAVRRSELKIERLINESAEYRRWAAELLPADVVRMRQRPEVTGAQDYLDWVSVRDAVPPAGDQPEPERPPEP